MISHDSRSASWNHWSSWIVIGCQLTASCLSQADLLGGAGGSGAAGFSGALASIFPFWLAAVSSGPRTGIPTAAGSLLVLNRFLLIVVGRWKVSSGNISPSNNDQVCGCSVHTLLLRSKPWFLMRRGSGCYLRNVKSMHAKLEKIDRHMCSCAPCSWYPSHDLLCSKGKQVMYKISSQYVKKYIFSSWGVIFGGHGARALDCSQYQISTAPHNGLKNLCSGVCVVCLCLSFRRVSEYFSARL